LFGLALGGSLLAGFSMAASKSQSLIHIVTFAAALAVTLYIVTDIEFPRMGLIRVGSFDHFLSDTLETLR
jgi:fructose-1-phosphate kinase PfkB-like protein